MVIKSIFKRIFFIYYFPNILGQIYEDLAQSSVKAVGNALGTVFEFSTSILLPVKLLNEKYGGNNKRDWDDNCHHNRDGAEHICKIFIEEVKKTDYPLNNYLK